MTKSMRTITIKSSAHLSLLNLSSHKRRCMSTRLIKSILLLRSTLQFITANFIPLSLLLLLLLLFIILKKRGFVLHKMHVETALGCVNTINGIFEGAQNERLISDSESEIEYERSKKKSTSLCSCRSDRGKSKQYLNVLTCQGINCGIIWLIGEK